MKNEAAAVFEAYMEALSRSDFEAVFNTISDEILWHMGGEGSLSGTISGKAMLKERLGEFASRSAGSFKIITNWYAANACLVAASVVSKARIGEKELNNPGIDLFKIENGKIQEVWTFSEHQADEDKFWE